MKEKFNMQKARQICEKCQSRDDAIDHDYWNAHAASVLPAALDRIETLEKALIDKQCRIIYGYVFPTEDERDAARDQLEKEGLL